MNSLHVFWSTFFNICRLRLKPEDLPYSNTLLSVTLLTYTIISFFLSLLQFSAQEALLSAVVDTGLLVILISSLLFFANHSTRITQTLTALAGANCVLGIISFPLIFWFGFSENHLSVAIILLLLAFLVWNMSVYAHIIQHALTVPFFVGALLTIVIYSLTFSVMNSLIPFAN